LGSRLGLAVAGRQYLLGQLRLSIVSGPCRHQDWWCHIESQTLSRTGVPTRLPTVDDGSTALCDNQPLFSQFSIQFFKLTNSRGAATEPSPDD